MKTVAEIRRQFPNPTRAPEQHQNRIGRYCVGGAFLLSLGGDILTDAFPGQSQLAREFLRQGLCGGRDAYTIAYLLIHANDNGNFERAWELLEEVLGEQPARKEEKKERELVLVGGGR